MVFVSGRDGRRHATPAPLLLQVESEMLKNQSLKKAKSIHTFLLHLYFSPYAFSLDGLLAGFEPGHLTPRY